MRFLLPLLFLPGCAYPLEPTGAFAAATAASVVVFGRGVVDIGVSAISGRDCSIVRLDRGQSYCAPRDQPPPRSAFCTRSLGVVDCWSNPEALPPGTRNVADAKRPTDEQDAYRVAPWPKSLTAGW